MAVQIKDNRIEIEIITPKGVADGAMSAGETAVAKGKQKQEQQLENAVGQAVSIAGNLPVVGKYVSAFSSIGGTVESVGTTLATGLAKGASLGAKLGVAGLAVSAVAFAHNFTSSYLQNKRQAEIMQRRAGFERRQT